MNGSFSGISLSVTVFLSTTTVQVTTSPSAVAVTLVTPAVFAESKPLLSTVATVTSPDFHTVPAAGAESFFVSPAVTAIAVSLVSITGFSSSSPESPPPSAGVSAVKDITAPSSVIVYLPVPEAVSVAVLSVTEYLSSVSAGRTLLSSPPSFAVQ